MDVLFASLSFVNLGCFVIILLYIIRNYIPEWLHDLFEWGKTKSELKHNSWSRYFHVPNRWCRPIFLACEVTCDRDIINCSNVIIDDRNLRMCQILQLWIGFRLKSSQGWYACDMKGAGGRGWVCWGTRRRRFLCTCQIECNITPGNTLGIWTCGVSVQVANPWGQNGVLCITLLAPT